MIVGPFMAVVDESRESGLESAPQYINRDVSWLEFNARVLEEAEDESNPLLERVKFLSIFSSNLDEFMMVRVSGIRSLVFHEAHAMEETPDRSAPRDLFDRIHDRIHQLVDRQYACLQQAVLPTIAGHGIRLRDPDELSKAQQQHVEEHFEQTVFPVLTPMAIDPSHPTPQLQNRGLYLAAMIQPFQRRRGGPKRLLAVVQIPAVLPRLVPLPGDDDDFILLDRLVASRLDRLFGGSEIVCWTTIRITRDADLDIDGDEVMHDLSQAIEEGLKALKHRNPVRLEVSAGADQKLVDTLAEQLQLEQREIYHVDGPLDLTILMAWHGLPAYEHLRDAPFTPRRPAELPEGADVFAAVRKRDILVHHPYESFGCVVDFLEQAAADPNVLAIKQTLYRSGSESPIVRALMNAAEAGKNVTAVVELKARFDERTNVGWARQMEQAGVHVVFGFLDLKTHCKITLVVRQEGSRLRRYVHLGTGNYNSATAKIYTDLGLFTSRQKFGDDATALFNMLTGYSLGHQWKRLIIAPHDLQPKTIDLIRRETEKAVSGQPARIFAKLNSLVDGQVIDALYEASQAGVEVDLLCRGSCCLVPGVPGLSENIRVRSIIDRFLEHSRIYIFGTGDEAEIYLSSADWMPRNFRRRVEAMFPILEPSLKARIVDSIVPILLGDNVKARVMQPDGSYIHSTPENGAPPLRAQMQLLDEHSVSESEDAGA